MRADALTETGECARQARREPFFGPLTKCSKSWENEAVFRRFSRRTSQNPTKENP
jgi:hypothetical protein